VSRASESAKQASERPLHGTGSSVLRDAVLVVLWSTDVSGADK
jgi:hypothetical protein